jgi:hypothetical protein
VESYFAIHDNDSSSVLVLNTTVEDLSRVEAHNAHGRQQQWRLTLRKHDPIRDVDAWWQETFDAVILANGHYTVPFVGSRSFLTLGV